MLNKEKFVEVVVDKDKCVKCGSCIENCSSYLKKDENGFPIARTNKDKENFMGCIQCGNCMMICPTEAIEIKGEDIDKGHLRELNPNLPDYDAINSLFLKRRSCRKFIEKDVPKEVFDKIINAAATAAVSIPPSEVKVLVINGKEKVRKFTEDLIKPLEKFTKMMNPIMLGMIGLMAGKVQYKMFKDFILPLSKEIIEKRKHGLDYLFYDAPAIMIFYGTEYTDKEDWLIASTQATLAAEALGLGTCIIGTVGAMLQTDPKLRKKYGFAKGDKLGTAFILGYPDVKYRKAFQRNFKEVRYI